MKHKKGFTLIEMLVAVLIITVLLTIALPDYFRAVERARMAEAEIMMGKVVEAQQRYKLRRGQSYSSTWEALDFAPEGVASGVTLVSPVAGAEEHGAFCTKMKDATTCGNGFIIELIGTSSADDMSGVIATRNGNSNFGRYQLFRYYDDLSFHTYCDGKGLESSLSNQAAALCIDFSYGDTYVDPQCKPGETPFSECVH